MKWNSHFLSVIICCFNCLSAQSGLQVPVDQKIKHKDGGCDHTVFVESPVADTYIGKEHDSLTHGLEPVLKVRGTPERKNMKALLAFEIHHLDVNYLQSAYLRIYTVSKDRGYALKLSSVGTRIDESETKWINQPSSLEMIDMQPISDAAFIQFEVSDYVRNQLSQGHLNFMLESGCKKPIDITSRESGLSAELILKMCDMPVLPEITPGKTRESAIRVLPSTLEGKLTIQVIRVPEGGFADLMLMTEQGAILFQVPLALQEAETSFHTIDFRNLFPGTYWAVLRKGRILIKDQFRLKSEQGSKHLHVDQDFIPEEKEVIHDHR